MSPFIPTISRLLDRGRQRLVSLARKCNVDLRQSYSRLGPRTLNRASSYAHARQFKRARKSTKKLKTYLGRGYRDVLRKMLHDPDLHAEFHEECHPRVGDRQKTSGDKECMRK